MHFSYLYAFGIEDTDLLPVNIITVDSTGVKILGYPVPRLTINNMKGIST